MRIFKLFLWAASPLALLAVLLTPVRCTKEEIHPNDGGLQEEVADGGELAAEDTADESEPVEPQDCLSTFPCCHNNAECESQCVDGATFACFENYCLLRADILCPGDSLPVHTASVSIANSAFTPECIAVEEGNMVTWTNNDSTAHSVVTLDGGVSSFASATLVTDGIYESPVLDSVGQIPYKCGIHASMTGTVIVFQSLPPASPDCP